MNHKPSLLHAAASFLSMDNGLKPLLNFSVGVPLLLTFLSGCSRQESTQPMPTNAVAMVGSQGITREAFETEFRSRGQVAPGRYADPMEKQVLLEELIRLEVLHQEALAAGYDQDPQIAASFKRMIAAKFLQDQLAALGEPEVSAEDIADYYRKNTDRFGTPEQIRAALIEIKVPRTATPEKRAEAEAKANVVLTEARGITTADGTFGVLAQRHSEDQASRYRGGDIGWLTVGDTNAPWDPAVMAAVGQLAQPGDLAPVIETPTAFYLLKLIDRRPASVRPLEEVKHGIAYTVARQKEQQQLNDLYHSLKEGLKIRTNTALLESIQPPAHKRRPPGVPGALSAKTKTP